MREARDELLEDTNALIIDEIIDSSYSMLSVARVYNLFQRFLGSHRAATRFVEEFITPFHGARVLDIGCGTGKLIEYLPPVDYVGFDMNAGYINYARKKYEGRGMFLHQDVSRRGLDQAGEFDFVLAVAILHHLTDDEAWDLFAMAYNRLKPGGCLVTLDCVFIEDQSVIARYVIARDRGRHVRTSEQYVALAKASFNDVRAHVTHDLLRIPYTHLIMKCFK
jgi:SAM-dependent methyltransferase